MANKEVFTRYEGNPIITASGLCDAHSVLNSAVVRTPGGYAGVFRVDNRSWYSELRAGTSEDGFEWRIDDEPIQFTSQNAVPHLNRPENSPYDPRITAFGDDYYVTFCHYLADGAAPVIGLAVTRDFASFELLDEAVLPYNRNAVLFPRKIDGRYAILHRPSDGGHTPFGDIFYAESPDLHHWGHHRFVFGPSSAWQATKVGPGPTPIETAEGWLLLYHGVKTTCSGFIYCAGGALLDLEEPWRVRCRSKRYLLAPAEPYERVGDVPNVVFPCGAVLDPGSGRLTMYYGCADTCVGAATAMLDDVLEFIRTNA
ncbi:MAG: glycoside hydrolase family 130 protein [Lentisphaerae bacterium]|nr:glycoside hydrolase family 130 protein [Lentisphaerota bacterium]